MPDISLLLNRALSLLISIGFILAAGCADEAGPNSENSTRIPQTVTMWPSQNLPKTRIILVQSEREPEQLEEFQSFDQSTNPDVSVEIIHAYGGWQSRSDEEWLQFEAKPVQEVFEKNLDKMAAFLNRETDENYVLALSGHSTGEVFWGYGVRIYPSYLTELAIRYPLFAAHVKMIYLLGCNAGRQYYIDHFWRPIFPNAWFVAGFNNVGPTGRGGGDEFFIQTLNAAGDKTPETILPDIDTFIQEDLLAKRPAYPDMYKAIEIYHQGNAHYFATHPSQNLQEAEHIAFGLELVQEYEAFLNAIDQAHQDPPLRTGNIDPNPTLPGYNPCRVRYNALQDYLEALSQSEYLSDHDREMKKKAEALIQESIRLTLFKEIQWNWFMGDENNRKEIFALLVDPDALAMMSRRELVAEITRLESVHHSTFTGNMFQALVKLDYRFLPITYIN